jgi:hypothetical protein
VRGSFGYQVCLRVRFGYLVELLDHHIIRKVRKSIFEISLNFNLRHDQATKNTFIFVKRISLPCELTELDGSRFLFDFTRGAVNQKSCKNRV